MPGKPQRVLLADHDTAGRAALAWRLRASGYEVEFASSGGDVIWHFSAAPPDVLILDVDLPDADGFELCEYVRYHLGGGETTVIFVCAAQDDMTRTYLAQMVDFADGDYFLAKPYDVRLITRVIEEALGQPDARDPCRSPGFPTRVVWPTSHAATAPAQKPLVELCGTGFPVCNVARP